MDINEIRKKVYAAIAEGRATYLPAGTRDNHSALVLIDGVVVAQAATIPNLYPDPRAGTFSEARLLPREEFFAICDE